METSKEYFQKIKFEDTIKLMGKTSLRLMQDLKNIYHAIDGKKNDVTMAVFGSPARYEMLPLSDVDVLLFTNDDTNQDNKYIIDKAKILIKSLPYDKIDIPIGKFSDVNNLVDLALSNSPDGHVVKTCLVEGRAERRAVQELNKARDISDRKKMLLENLIFDHHYINYRAHQKHNPLGANLKYSRGGSRDIIYFDWASDYLTGAKTSSRARSTGVPQIKYSVPIVCDYIGEQDTQDNLVKSINVINTVKNQALTLKKQGGHFDGLMSEETAKQLLFNYDYRNAGDVNGLISAHELARSIIASIKQKIYNKTIKDIDCKLDETEDVKYLLSIDSIWNNSDPNKRDEIIKSLLERGRWVDVATVICQDNADADSIDRAVAIALKKPAYAHILRIAAKHVNTASETLYKILASNQVAGDEDVDRRYRDIIIKRLEARK
jgi:predicted nucleotidyltransferase